MARIPKQKNYKKALAVGLGCLLLAALIILVLELTNTTHLFHESQAEKDQKTAGQVDSAKKKAFTQANGTKSTGKDGQAQSSYTPPSNASNISITPSQQGSTVVLSTKLYGYSDGNCGLTITNAGKTYSNSASVIYASDFSTCAGFSVPVSALGSGTWNITLSITSDGITTTKTVSFEAN